jgi:hypothetical protein
MENWLKKIVAKLTISDVIIPENASKIKQFKKECGCATGSGCGIIKEIGKQKT